MIMTSVQVEKPQQQGLDLLWTLPAEKWSP